MKNSDKTFFLLPGFKMQAGGKAFRWLVSFLEDKNFQVIKTPVHWNYRTLSQNTADFIEFFARHRTENSCVLGFSYGAVIAFLSANVTKPRRLFLCSLSCDFSEDRKSMSPLMVRYIGKKRFADTLTRNGRDLARQLKIPTVIFYGEREGKHYPALKKRCEETARLAKNTRLVVIDDAPHQIDFPAYSAAIRKELTSL